MGKIVWIASYPKSGNTWARIFLFNLFLESPEPLPLSDVSRMSTSDTVLRWYKEVDDRDPATWTTEDIADMRPKVQRHLASLTDKPMFTKTHAALVLMAGRQPFDMEVTGAAIYVVRNPLDVAVSYARHGGVPVDDIIQIMSTPNHMLPRTDALVEFVQGGWTQHVMSWTREPSPTIYVVRYEDMVADPMSAFGGICAFLKLEVPPESLEQAINHASIDTLRRLESEQGFNERSANQERFFGEGGVDSWRGVLSDDQVRQIVSRHGRQMARFGYVPERFQA